MSDSKSAMIYGDIFIRLASDPTPQHKRWAKKFWKESADYDFHPADISIDDILIKLGLAKLGSDHDYPEDGEVVLYKDLDY